MPSYLKGFIPYGLAAFLIGIVGGFSTVLGPAFVSDLGLGYNNTTWTALATAMSAAACAPILGKLGDVFGRRLTLLAGIGIYTIGNILNAVAGSLAFMLAARFVVGIGTAAISPIILAYIVAEFPKEKLSGGFSLYMLISSSAVVFGPALGGLITESYGWRTMMWLCAAISALVFVLCFALGSEKTVFKPMPKDFDYMGAAFVIVFFSLALCIPSFAQNFGAGSPHFLVVMAAALIALAALVTVERRAHSPILPGSILRRKGFILPIAVLFLTQGLMQANITNVLVFARYARPDDTVLSAYSVSILYLGMSIGSVLLGPMADRSSARRILTLALSLCGIGCAALLFTDEKASFMLMAFSLGMLGLGLGGSGTILMKTALSGIDPVKSGAASGTYNLFRDLSAPFGVAVLVPFFTNRTSSLILSGIEGASASASAMRGLAFI
ncbi:MAG: MFS transporter, partial [Clostridia bacterium]|nr:MFS transporter [Clostridia bacterium]